MSKRDLLRKANAGNAQKRGTEAVLNEEPIEKALEKKPIQPKKPVVKEAPTQSETREEIPQKIIEPIVSEIVEEKPAELSIETPVEKVVETPKTTEITETSEIIETGVKTENVKSSFSSKSSRISKPAISANLAKYTGTKISKSIMLTAEDNKYLIKQAAAQKKPIQDIFGEVMADEIEEVKKGNIDEALAETFLKLKANNERRNVLIPEDLSIAIADTACEIPLKQGKFILYALSRKRQMQ